MSTFTNPKKVIKEMLNKWHYCEIKSVYLGICFIKYIMVSVANEKGTVMISNSTHLCIFIFCRDFSRSVAVCLAFIRLTLYLLRYIPA